MCTTNDTITALPVVDFDGNELLTTLKLSFFGDGSDGAGGDTGTDDTGTDDNASTDKDTDNGTDKDSDKDNNKDKDTGKDDKGKQVKFTAEQEAVIEAMLKDKTKEALDEYKKTADEDKQNTLAEHEKLSKMNDQERAEYQLNKELEQLREAKAESDRRIADFEKRETVMRMRGEVTNMLSTYGVSAPNDNVDGFNSIVESLVADTAEETKSRVNAFGSVFKSLLDEGVKNELRGTTKRTTAVSKEGEKFDIDKYANMSTEELLEIAGNNPTLYQRVLKELTK